MKTIFYLLLFFSTFSFAQVYEFVKKKENKIKQQQQQQQQLLFEICGGGLR